MLGVGGRAGGARGAGCGCDACDACDAYGWCGGCGSVSHKNPMVFRSLFWQWENKKGRDTGKRRRMHSGIFLFNDFSLVTPLKSLFRASSPWPSSRETR